MPNTSNQEMSPEEIAHLKKKKLEILERKLFLKENLPFMPGPNGLGCNLHPLYQWQEDFIASTNNLNFLTASNQSGKALRVDTPIPTPNGWVKIGDLKVGDYVFSRDGSPVKIIDIPYEGKRQLYRLTFSDGSTIDASGEHLWVCKTEKERFRKGYSGYNQWVVKTTQEIIDAGGYSPNPKSNVTKASIPITKPVQYPHRGLFDPYLIGLWIGDGSKGASVIHKPDKDIHRYVLATHGGLSRDRYVRVHGELTEQLKRLGLRELGSHERFIPPEYLQASVEERLALLRGLMDTDGTIYSKRQMSYCTTSPQLRDDVCELLASLGAVYRIKAKHPSYLKDGKRIQCKDAWEIILKIDINPFYLPRKANLYREKIRYRHERVINSIEPIDVGDCRCISVEGDETFLAGREFIVTHNSSGGIIKCLRWGYMKELWPELWPNHTPNLFFYYYPDRDTAEREFRTKWAKYLPQKPLKDDPYWGWKETKDKNSQISSIRLNSGIVIYFLCYTQAPENIQASTVDAAFADEEMPIRHFSECQLRVSRGYYHNFFTATLGQPYLYATMERPGKPDENFPMAFKRQISMYDCLVYSDGTKSEHITEEYIEQRKASLPDQNEILKRIYGRFVKTEGLRFQSFEYDKNVIKHHPLPRSWQIYVGIDFGSGGEHNHPSAIVFVGVSPDFVRARVFKSWVGRGIKTTQGDVIEKYIELSNGLAVTSVFYDFSATDLGEIAQRIGLPFQKADKSHDGIALVNTLFKNEQLKVFHDQHEVISELQTVADNKNADGDDVTDALRYAIALVPFQIKILTQQDKEEVKEDDPYKDMDPRMRFYKGIDRDPLLSMEESMEMDIDEVAEMFETGGF